MKKAMRKFFADGGGAQHFSLSYYSPDVDARDSLQVIYQREDLPQTYDPETNGGEGQSRRRFLALPVPA